MDKEQYLKDLTHAHNELNRLLMEAYQHSMICNLSVNEAKSSSSDDCRQILGLTVVSEKIVYVNNGVP